MKKIILLAGSALFLCACSTTVITGEERALPEPTLEPAAGESQPEANLGEEGSPLVMRTADTEQSFIAFTCEKPNIISHEGKFNEYDAVVTFQDEIPIMIDIMIEISSIETESEKLTKHLLTEDFFHVEKYPISTFSSTEITPTDKENNYTVIGNLEMHGITKEITADAVITQEYVLLNYSLDRTEFGVGGPEDGLRGISATVPIEAKIVFVEE